METLSRITRGYELLVWMACHVYRACFGMECKHVLTASKEMSTMPGKTAVEMSAGNILGQNRAKFIIYQKDTYFTRPPKCAKITRRYPAPKRPCAIESAEEPSLISRLDAFRARSRGADESESPALSGSEVNLLYLSVRTATGHDFAVFSASIEGCRYGTRLHIPSLPTQPSSSFVRRLRSRHGHPHNGLPLPARARGRDGT